MSVAVFCSSCPALCLIHWKALGRVLYGSPRVFSGFCSTYWLHQIISWIITCPWREDRITRWTGAVAGEILSTFSQHTSFLLNNKKFVTSLNDTNADCWVRPALCSFLVIRLRFLFCPQSEIILSFRTMGQQDYIEDFPDERFPFCNVRYPK